MSGPDSRVGRNVSHYCVVERLGGGGTGLVFTAVLNWQAALKK
jgi:hypothetical protein